MYWASATFCSLVGDTQEDDTWTTLEPTRRVKERLGIFPGGHLAFLDRVAFLEETGYGLVVLIQIAFTYLPVFLRVNPLRFTYPGGHLL